MERTPEPKKSSQKASHDESPEGTPPTTAILPPSLASAREKCLKAQKVSMELRKSFEALSRVVEPEVEPDMPLPEPTLQESFKLASLGIELASKEKEAIQLERAVTKEEQKAGLLKPKVAEKRLDELGKRYLSAGDDLWRHKKRKTKCNEPGTVQWLDPRSMGFGDCLQALYKTCDGLQRKKRPSAWRSDALAYYKGNSKDHEGAPNGSVWCHVTGQWQNEKSVKAAHIVPFFLDCEKMSEMLFGSRAESLKRAGNALLLTSVIEGWFDSYHLIIVPVDATETPITRWRTDIISPDIQNTVFSNGEVGRDLDGKELVFLNEKRPVSRFMYFHFIMALVRIKNVERHNWQSVWARYYEQRPFPTPGKYMRQSMLLALATHFETTNLQVVNSWIEDQGFDSPLKISDDEVEEAARRVHVAVQQAIARAEKAEDPEADSSDESSDRGSDEESKTQGRFLDG